MTGYYHQIFLIIFALKSHVNVNIHHHLKLINWKKTNVDKLHLCDDIITPTKECPVEFLDEILNYFKERKEDD